MHFSQTPYDLTLLYLSVNHLMATTGLEPTTKLAEWLSVRLPTK